MSVWNGASWVSSRCGQACASLLPRDPQEGIRLGASLARARLVAVRPRADAVTGERPQPNRDDTRSCGGGPLRPQAVPGRQRLARPWPAHLAWHAPVPQGGVGHDGTEQVVNEQMAPARLAHQRGRLAPQPLPRHGLCDRAQRQFRLPPCPLEPDQLRLGVPLTHFPPSSMRECIDWQRVSRILEGFCTHVITHDSLVF